MKHICFCIWPWYGDIQKISPQRRADLRGRRPLKSARLCWLILPRVQRTLSLAGAAGLARGTATATATARRTTATARSTATATAATALASLTGAAERGHQLGKTTTRIARAISALAALTCASLLGKTTLGVARAVESHSIPSVAIFILKNHFRPDNRLQHMATKFGHNRR